jgi:hypothetical protein
MIFLYDQDAIAELIAMMDDEVEGFLIEVPRWDLTVHNPRYIRFVSQDLMVKFMSDPAVTPIKMVLGNSWKEDGLEGFLAKDSKDTSIALVEVATVPVMPYFKQAFDLEAGPVEIFSAHYAGYTGSSRPAYTRLIKRIHELAASYDPVKSIDLCFKPMLFEEEGHQVLKLGLWKRFFKAPKVIDDKNALDHITFFKFPGDDQPGELDKAHKFIDQLLDAQDDKKKKLRKPENRENGRPAHFEGGYKVPPARNGRHYW